MKLLLKKKECKHGCNREFSAYFKPDANHEDWEIGMQFYVVSVNRQTGEIKFSIDLEAECRIKEEHINV